MKKVNYKEMGERIKTGRKLHGITQEKLAEEIDVSPSYISEIERGSSICSLEVLVAIASVLDLNLDNLVNGINESNAKSSFAEILKNIPKDKQNLYINICENVAKSFK